MEDPLLTARAMIKQQETDLDELWLGYFVLGRNATKMEFEAFICGIRTLFDLNLDLLRFALESAPDESITGCVQPPQTGPGEYIYAHPEDSKVNVSIELPVAGTGFLSVLLVSCPSLLRVHQFVPSKKYRTFGWYPGGNLYPVQA